MPIKITSANACGLADDFKRRQLFRHLKKKQNNVIFLQETHSTAQKAKIWKSQWGGPCFLDHGESNARGAAILIAPGTNIEIQSVEMSGQGRFVLLQGRLESKSVVLLKYLRS